jgi:hypothetical protein
MELGKVAAAAAELGQVQVEAVCARSKGLSAMVTLEAKGTSDGGVPFLLYTKEKSSKKVSEQSLSFHEILGRYRFTYLFKVELSGTE